MGQEELPDEPPDGPCWLLELEKYAQTEKVRQRENFFTTALTWAAESDPEFKRLLLAWLFDGRDLAHATLRTQRSNADGKRPDITVRDQTADFIAAIECKVDAQHDDESKVVGYLRALDKELDVSARTTKAVAYIAKSHPLFNDEQLKDRTFLWARLYEKLELWLRERQGMSPIANDLVAYMRSAEMVPQKPIREDPCRVVATYNQFMKSIRSIVELAASQTVANLRGELGEDITFELDGVEDAECYYGRRINVQPDDVRLGLYFRFKEDVFQWVVYISQAKKGSDSAARTYGNFKDAWLGAEEQASRAFPGLANVTDLAGGAGGFFSKTFDEQVRFVSDISKEALLRPLRGS